MSNKPLSLLRTFFAIDVDPSARIIATKLIKNLKRLPHGSQVRWVKPENLHITLRFLGEITETQLKACIAKSQEKLISIKPFELELSSLILFPLHRPHIIAVTITHNKTLLALAKSLEQVAADVGLIAETRAFFPHLTLGRIRSNFVLPQMLITSELPYTYLINEVILYCSELRSTGSVYTMIRKFTL